MKITVLMENRSRREDMHCAHGLSLYIEAGERKLLLDMGPDDKFIENAKQLGIDLAEVDTAFLSHGHYDHAGGLAAFCECNSKAKIYMEKEAFGGQITITHEVVNYPGVARPSGKELTETMRRQAESFGAEFLIAEAESLDLTGDVKTVHTNRGDYQCFGILLATGAHPRSVGFKGEEEHKGRGVAYCATCDGEFFTDKEVFVVGGGFAAAEESVFLTKFARHVTVLVRKDDFSCAASVADKTRNHEKITVLTNTVVEEVSGENGLDYIRYKNTATGEVTEYRAENGGSFGVFVFVGDAPNTALVKKLAELDEQGYIITDATQKTSMDGLYAAGDVCIKPLRQVVTAVGDGALAATELEKYAAQMQRKTGLRPVPPEAKSVREDTRAATPLTEAPTGSNDLFTPEMKAQLDTVFGKMARPLLLKLYLDSRPVSKELEEYMTALDDLSEKLTVEKVEREADSELAPCTDLPVGRYRDRSRLPRRTRWPRIYVLYSGTLQRRWSGTGSGRGDSAEDCKNSKTSGCKDSGVAVLHHVP